MSSDTEWFLEDDFWSIFYECMFNEETFHSASEELHLLMNLLSPPGDRIADIGCGPGRHVVPIAAAGYDVIGVDIIEPLLEKAREYTEQSEAQARFVRADMRSLTLPEPVDGLICMWTSFGYFDAEEEVSQTLRGFRENLVTGGRVLIDVVGKEIIARDIQPVHLTELPSGDLLVERPLVTDQFKRYENQWLLISGDRVHRRSWGHYLYTPTELSSLLAAAGFCDIEVFGSLEGDPYDQEAERLIVTATAAG